MPANHIRLFVQLKYCTISLLVGSKTEMPYLESGIMQNGVVTEIMDAAEEIKFHTSMYGSKWFTTRERAFFLIYFQGRAYLKMPLQDY